VSPFLIAQRSWQTPSRPRRCLSVSAPRPKQVDKSFVTFTRDKFIKISGDDITVVTELLSTCLETRML
jgi:hypothetical protein